MLSLAVVHSRGVMGVNAPDVTVECHMSFGLPKVRIVGLPEKSVKESTDRVRSAILNSQFDFPAYRITVNLAPADLPKESGRLDLPIAISILAASKQIPSIDLDNYEFASELALSGELRPVSGMLPVAIATKAANKILITSHQDAAEASLVKGLTILPAKDLGEVCAHLVKGSGLTSFSSTQTEQAVEHGIDLQDVMGQEPIKRVLEIAAAGGHSLLMAGPPGTGKTMLASRLPTILPSMSIQEALDSAAVMSVSYQGFDVKKWRLRPFRAPHHSASSVALVGGGNPPKPGEISLAHNGVLFLDELPEFARPVLEALREPLESGCVTISRAARQCRFPANFQLVAAMNPCPCGFLGDPEKACRCSPDQIQRYKNKLSGPFLDRIDLFVQVPRVKATLLSQKNKIEVESSQRVKQRVEQARRAQYKRAEVNNACLSNQQLELYCQLGRKEAELFERAVTKFNLSARAFHRALKVARTIADLAGSEPIQYAHVAEALSYRQVE